MALKLLADMNLSPLTVAALKADGYDIARVSSLLPATTADSVILHLARQQEMVIVTQDLDFSTLLASGISHQPHHSSTTAYRHFR